VSTSRFRHEDEDSKIALAPMAVRAAVTVSPRVIQVPRMQITPMAFPQMKLAPMKIEIPKIQIQPMKLDIPKIKIEPMKVLVVPRRIVL
jgi:hypothetical protein